MCKNEQVTQYGFLHENVHFGPLESSFLVVWSIDYILEKCAESLMISAKKGKQKNMGRYYYDKKDTVEDCRTVSKMC